MSAARCSTRSTPATARTHHLGVADVAEYHFRAPVGGGRRILRGFVEPPGVPEGVVEAEGPDRRPSRERGLDQVAADEAVRTGHQNGATGQRRRAALAHWCPFARARSAGVPTSIQSDGSGHALT